MKGLEFRAASRDDPNDWSPWMEWIEGDPQDLIQLRIAPGYELRKLPFTPGYFRTKSSLISSPSAVIWKEADPGPDYQRMDVVPATAEIC